MSEQLQGVGVTPVSYWSGGWASMVEDDPEEAMGIHGQPVWTHGMDEGEWLAYRPLRHDEVIATSLVVLDGPFDDGTHETEPRSWLDRIRAFIWRRP